MPYDLVIKDGTVIDPSQDLRAIRDVALTGGRIAAVKETIPSSEANEVLDASGLIVTPGLVDLHIHAFWGATHYGVSPDPVNIAKGVTTALDAGSAGARTFPVFRRYVLERSKTRLYALLNISAMGMISPKIGELEDLRWADVEDAANVGQANRDYVLGIKARLSTAQAGNNDCEVLKRSIAAAEILEGFVMIHVGDTYSSLEKLLAMLRPGDMVTHAFHGRSHGLMDDSDRVREGVREAQRRGVVFDIGHGRGSLSFRTLDKVLSQDFFPDNISSDLHIKNIEGPVFDQVTTLSKFLYAGMPLDEVIRLSTVAPATVLGLHDRLGTLKVGAEGDVTVLKLDEGRFTLTDSNGVSVEAKQRLKHVATISNGQIYRPWLN